MTLDLPEPIANYFAAQRRDDFEALSRCFVADAIVLDEGGQIIGPAAIGNWMSEAKRKYRHKAVPLSILERDGGTVVLAQVSGDFPGSPIRLEHTFHLVGAHIRSLAIRW